MGALEGAIPAADGYAGSSPEATAPRSGRPRTLALLEVLDRDGQPRQSLLVHAWPVRIGRALDNDLVLSDAHVAAHHFEIAAGAHGLTLTLAETSNGALLGHHRLRHGDVAPLAATGEPVEIMVGRTHLRLRLPGHVLAAELPMAVAGSSLHRALLIAFSALLLIAGTVFTTYLDTDPDGLTRAIGNMLLTTFVVAVGWCAIWALLSKTFTRQAQFGWHLRVFLFASLALLALSVLPALLGFAFSWPWVTDFAFVATIAVAAVTLYFHLLAVEPARQRWLKWAAVSCAAVGVVLTLWFNLQRNDQLGDELYMNHLFPPALRIAKPVPLDGFIDGLASLKPKLDKKAREPGRGEEGGRSDDE